MLRSSRAPIVISVLIAAACAAKPDVRNAKEASPVSGLSFTIEVDATRLARGTGLPPVPAIAQLVEDNLARYFRVLKTKTEDDRRELLGESPAPGFAVRVVIEARPDDFCVVTLDAVGLAPGGVPAPVLLAPYSVHAGMHALRTALGSLRSAAGAPLSDAQFEELRKQATALAARGGDIPIDANTYARTPRPLEREETPRYYAPADTRSTLRPE